MVFSGVCFRQRDFCKTIKTEKGQICYSLLSIQKQCCSVSAASKFIYALLE